LRFPTFEEGKSYRLIYRIHTYTQEDTWEKEYTCHKCNNNKWLVSYKTGTKKKLGEDIKLKCTECGMWFITKERLLSKVLGDY
jgi:transcription elongation factor Elf1